MSLIRIKFLVIEIYLLLKASNKIIGVKKIASEVKRCMISEYVFLRDKNFSPVANFPHA